MASLFESPLPKNVTFYREDDPVKDMIVFTLKIRCLDDGVVRLTRRHIGNEHIYNSKIPYGEIENFIAETLTQYFYQYVEKEHDGCKACLMDIETTFKALLSKSYPKQVPAAIPVTEPTAAQQLSSQSFSLPGVNAVVRYPCTDCNFSGKSIDIRTIIMHLNDWHKWTRQEIADWLESIDDPENGIDLAFSVPERKVEINEPH